MNKLPVSIIIILVLTSIFSCQKEDDPFQEPGLVINELMPVNSTYVTDQNGQYDDWIELYNNQDENIDLSGYFLSDSKSNPTKWSFPDATVIAGKSYLIIWADGDTLQQGLHTNYKLSSEGETVLLSDPELLKIDQVEYEANILQQSYARIPNGTGEFVWNEPSFNAEN